ncbi:hypothetical protein [Sulfuracidifex tepidarius]|uniref:Uncharacterized protein n=1 Tax=Sulfuracidifex tepidarius TaxID=1294262 RepID=A0A510E6J3_9CREN|nr:hypothetical protein [Sulfuracidifex tepidarius]BBG24863.1 hypothetical protein IC006_2197 [Sulfuracidifex tepidarius]BBG27648.1 hypothetical protein IC007_2202 [Sulfuracidifex tepidarius]
MRNLSLTLRKDGRTVLIFNGREKAWTIVASSIKKFMDITAIYTVRGESPGKLAPSSLRNNTLIVCKTKVNERKESINVASSSFVNTGKDIEALFLS